MLPTSRVYEFRTLLLLGFAYGFAFFDRQAMSFLSPYVVRDLGLTNTQVGMLAAGLSVTWALGAYLVGRWSDSVGRRKPFLLAAMFIFSLCSVLSGLSATFGTLLASRMLMGAAEGPFLPICLAIMTAVSAPSRRGLNAGILQNVFGSLLGAALAPIILIAVAEMWGWRAAFYGAGVPGLICALLIWRYVAEPPRTVEPAAAMAPLQRTSIVAMLRHRNIALCAGISCCMVGTVVLGSIFLPLYFTQVRGFDTRTMGNLMAVLGLCPAVGGVLIPALSDRIGRRIPMIVFCTLTALCPLAALGFHGPVAMLGVLLFIGWLGAGVFPLFMGIIPAETLGPARAATAMGLVIAVGELTGGVLGPLFGGMAADRAGLAMPIMVQAGFAVVAGILSFFLVETNPRFAARQAATDRSAQPA